MPDSVFANAVRNLRFGAEGLTFLASLGGARRLTRGGGTCYNLYVLWAKAVGTLIIV